MIARRRGAAFLEFVLVLPFLLGVLLLTLDVGRLVLAQASLQDATSAAARAGARVGYAGGAPSQNCSAGASSVDIAYRTFCTAAQGMPTGPILSFTINEPLDLTPLGATCTSSIGSQYVRVTATSDFRPLTPGLALFSGSAEGGLRRMDIASTSVARCEISR